MTWNREEALRLAQEAREDDARMTPGPWRRTNGGAGIVDSDSEFVLRVSQDVPFSNADGIARTRNNLRAIADKLSAAAAEIDRRDRIEAGRERLTDTIDRLTAELDQLRSEGAARMDATEELLRARIAELTAERDKLRSDYTGWSEYSTELADERDHLRRARDTAMEAGEVLRQQRDASLARVKELKEQVDLLKSTVDLDEARKVRADASKRTHLELQVGQLELRVKELEAERDAACEDMSAAEERMAGVLDGTFSIGDGSAQRQIERLTTILRAIYPVYRAANEWVVNGRNRQAFVSATHAARTALTPELIAAIKAAGVEEP